MGHELTLRVERSVGTQSTVVALRKCFENLRTASDQALQEVRLASGVTDVNSGTLIFLLGEVLYTSLFVLARAAICYGFDPADAYRSAVIKVRGRTPYMKEWGDGSVATTAEAAEAIWKSRKKEEKMRVINLEKDAAEIACVSNPRDELVFTIGRLVAAGGCPWTFVQKAEDLLCFLQGECVEAIDEIDALAAGPETRSSD